MASPSTPRLYQNCVAEWLRIDEMDPVSELFYTLNFRIAFLEKKGMAFQDWFVSLAGRAMGSDFEAVRPYGNQGDWKCDGRQLSTGTIFQCYAPEAATDQKTIAKIDDDFAGALAKWPNFIRAWTLVHNDYRGVPAAVASHLDTKRQSHPEIKFAIWAEPQLSALFNQLNADAKRSMFGAVPTQRQVDGLVLKDLEPVIDALERRDPDPTEPLPPPPSARKLEKNELSPEAADFLRMGRRKVRLVETYFRKIGPVELGETIAEAFRRRYEQLTRLGLSTDQIFMYLQRYAGVHGEPRHQVAAMAIIAYLFDNCDIFEDPDELAMVK